jgi:hypothetical protein
MLGIFFGERVSKPNLLCIMKPYSNTLQKRDTSIMVLRYLMPNPNGQAEGGKKRMMRETGTIRVQCRKPAMAR